MILLRTLGTLDLRKGEVSLSTILAQPKRLAILVYLAAARPRGFHSRDRLVALFWPESDAERARNSLRQALHHLRRSLGEDAIVGRGDHELGVDHTIVICDAVQFDDAIAAGKWEEALERYQGDYLSGLFVQEAPEVERWIDGERAFRRRQAVDAAWKLSEGAELAGDLAGATKWAHRAVELDPDNESSKGRLEAVLSRPATARPVVLPAPSPPSSPAHAMPVSSEPALVVASSASPVASPSPGGATDAGHRRRHASYWLIAAAVVLVGGVTFAIGRASSGETVAPDQPSIAVLPFRNLSPDPANEFLSDGMTEELLHLLAQVPGIQVAARTSAFAYKNKDLPIDSIGRALRVRSVLEGSVRQSGNRVRITAQLVDARSGYHIWSGNFERAVDDVFEVQDSIGRAIVQSLRPRLVFGGDVPSVPHRREPRDPEAHISAMKGWQTFRRNSREAFLAAEAHFQDAIRRDPEYGYAIAGLATVRHWQANRRYLPPDSAYAEARALAHRALELDSSLVDGYLVLGRIAERVDRDYDKALEYFGRAVQVAPSDARTYERQAVLLALLGREEDALASARYSVELDPASPAAHAGLAQLYGTLDRYADAEAAYRQALTLDPGHPILLRNLANNLVRQRKYDEAQRTILEARRRAPAEVDLIGMHAYIASSMGNRALTLALLDTASAMGLSLVDQASILVSLGDTASALAALARAVRERDDGATMLLDTTAFRALRSHPEYQRLVAEVRGRSGGSR